jgi:hypothetical protein
MTDKTDGSKDTRPKNPLVEGMRKSRGAGASPEAGTPRTPGSPGKPESQAMPRTESSSRGGGDDYQTGGLRWPD